MLKGEEIKLGIQPPQVIDRPDQEINEKYVKGEVRIVTEQARYPLSSIPQMLDSDNYLLRPEYQRRHRWSNEKKSRLIESLVMNVPIPPIFLYEYEYSKYEVMDGLQRLSTIQEFYSNQLELTGLTEWEELNGRTYSSLPDRVRAGIDRRYLSSIILLQETAKTGDEARILKQLVFERINSGGERLMPQESRNAVFPGPMNELCLSLSRRHSLCLMWGIPIESDEDLFKPSEEVLLENSMYREMFDVELVLRFFAFRQDEQYLRGALRDYLDEYQRHANRFPDSLRLQMGKIFADTSDLCYDALGERAFWLWRKRGTRWNWLSRPTTIAYDTIMWVLSNRLDQADKIRASATTLRAEMPRFYEQHYDKFAGRYTNPSNIVERRRFFSLFLHEILARVTE